MSFKYHPLLNREEKFLPVFRDRSSTGDSQHSTLLECQNGSETTDGPLPHHFSMKLLWLGQATLFLLSCTMFFSAIFIRSSTLKHVRDFSPYCMLVLLYAIQKICWCACYLYWPKCEKTAPAATAVEYQSVKFNVTTEDNPFVGAGPEVDRAWREISYDGKQHHSANSDWNETMERLGRLWDL